VVSEAGETESMSAAVGDRLALARQQQFVGRAAELALFQSALGSAEAPFSVLYIFGPPGVGKTTLLRRFALLCDQEQIPVYMLDGRAMEATPSAFLDALRRVLELRPEEDPTAALWARMERQVLLIDTYEALAPLDSWLREVFLPQLSTHVLVVLASRRPPATPWQADPGWQNLLRVLALRNLTPGESRLYLTRRGVPAVQQERVLAFTHGHPLALSLVADLFAQRSDLDFRPEAAPDMVGRLLEQLLLEVPGPLHRLAIEACAVVRVMTESLLAEMLAIPDAHDLFQWLRTLSFIEAVPRGVVLHDLAREAIAADLRWRNPDRYRRLHDRARAYYAARLDRGDERSQQALLADYIYLHRDNPLLQPLFTQLEEEVESFEALWIDLPRPDDWPILRAMVAQHEGEPAAQLADYWWSRQPEGVRVVRNHTHRPVGMLFTVILQESSVHDLAFDPATRAAWQYLETTRPLREGERAALFRFWLAQETYQAPSPVQGLIAVQIVRYALSTARLAVTFLPCAEPELWEFICAYADFARVTEADFEIAGRRYGVYMHDWRVVPPAAWLELLAERELTTEPVLPQPGTATQVLALSREEFAAAVKAALRAFQQPLALGENPLLRTRLVLDRSGWRATTTQRVTTLREILMQALETLRSAPRLSKAYAALFHTYIQPAPSQEHAADLLNVPPRTFRRHLKCGVAYVTELLWRQELYGPFSG